MVETHASRTLYNRFEDESCQFIGMFLQQMLQRTDVFRVPFISEPGGGSREEVADGKCRTKDTVHPRYRIAYRHGIPGISVVTVTDGDEIIFLRFSGCIPVLYGHLQCNFDSYGAGIGIEYLLHRGRDQRKQQFAQFDSRIVRQSAEHDMRHPAELILYSLV